MKRFTAIALFLAAVVLMPYSLHAQGVTTGAIAGRVIGADGAGVSSATVTALHQPTGTRYGAITRADGRYSIPGMRVGGPYSVSVSHIGFEDETRDNVFVNLGVSTDLTFNLRERAVTIEGITATAERNAIMSSERTGASTAISRELVATMPTVSQRLEDMARLTPQAGGCNLATGCSFAGQDGRMNNITVDGSYFNNSFGLSGLPGDRTGVAPISLAAIEQVQINVAPFDVRQGNFIGAGINTVTRSGTNQFRGSVYRMWRNDGMVGDKAGTSDFDPGEFSFENLGGWVSGPIIQNKLFFFANYESDGLESPGTTFRANTGSEEVGGNVTRVSETELTALSDFLRTNFDYETGPFQGYSHETPAKRFLGKLDYSLNDRNKFSLRYTHLDSNTDVLASNSSSLGFGNRRTSTNALNFQNSNYMILENIRSVVGEWNSLFGGNKANNFIVGFTSQDESRDSRGSFFPMADILRDGTTYTTFGFEPFTPNNELRYKTFQLQNNFSIFGERHSWTFGASFERYESENVFFPGSQSAYVYNSLADFYTDANDFIANPNRTTSPVTLRRFQVRWSNIEGQEKPIQPLEVFYAGIYGQDEWQVNSNLKVTLGLRLDVPKFGDTGFANEQVDGMNFRDEDGNSVKYSTSKLPDANLHFSPRVGFNLDVFGDRSTQVRGGTGIFTGRPAYVWISNQIGENGVLTGFEQIENTTARPFHPDPNHYKPATITGDPASSYGLAFTDPDFKFPQLWRTNLAVDHRLPWGVIGTGEFMYNKDVNGVYYINANLKEANTAFNGADDRPRWTTGNRVNSNITSAIVLKNQNEGTSWNVAASLEKPFANGLFLKAAYSYGEAKNTVDPGSIAFGSWNNNQHAGDPNNPGLGYALSSPGHRLFGAASYRADWFRFGSTTLSMFAETRTIGNTSFTYSGDLNGDGGTSNDLIYIPADQSEMNFQTYTANGVTYTAAQQAAAWDAYIEQDDYLSDHRGEYAERGAVFLPMVKRIDVSIAQDLFTDIRGTRNGLQLRADILNFGNMLNSDWGVSQRMVSTTPLVVPSSSQGGPADSQGRAQYRMRAVGDELMSTTFEPTAFLEDVYRVQFSLRYTFN